MMLESYLWWIVLAYKIRKTTVKRGLQFEKPNIPMDKVKDNKMNDKKGQQCVVVAKRNWDFTAHWRAIYNENPQAS